MAEKDSSDNNNSSKDRNSSKEISFVEFLELFQDGDEESAKELGEKLSGFLKEYSEDAPRLLVELGNREIHERILSPNFPSSDVDIKIAFAAAGRILPGYSTLEWRHCEDILQLRDIISAYKKDATLKRPLNILLQAAPGSGKSYFVECLVKSLSEQGFGQVSFNMTALQDEDGLAEPIDEVRNLKIADQLPVLFLDEFDSKEELYGRLLPLLWDGEIAFGSRKLDLGKVVIILAGSGKSVQEAVDNAGNMSSPVVSSQSGNAIEPGNGEDADIGKLKDLLSRINGGELSIPSLEDRPVDKICLALSVIQQRFDKEVVEVPHSLLRFIGEVEFAHGARSVGLLIDQLPTKRAAKSKLRQDELNLPLSSVAGLKNSPLKYHLRHKDGAKGIVDLWQFCNRSRVMVKFSASPRPKSSESLLKTILKGQFS